MKRKHIYGLLAGIGILAGIASGGYSTYKIWVKNEFTKKDLALTSTGLGIMAGVFVGAIGTYFVEEYHKLKKQVGKQNQLEKETQK